MYQPVLSYAHSFWRGHHDRLERCGNADPCGLSKFFFSLFRSNAGREAELAPSAVEAQPQIFAGTIDLPVRRHWKVAMATPAWRSCCRAVQTFGFLNSRLRDSQSVRVSLLSLRRRADTGSGQRHQAFRCSRRDFGRPSFTSCEDR